MESCLLGIKRKDRKIMNGLDEKKDVIDVVHSMKSLEWKWTGYLG